MIQVNEHAFRVTGRNGISAIYCTGLCVHPEGGIVNFTCVFIQCYETTFYTNLGMHKLILRGSDDGL
jgi:hypothetical protein